MKKCKGTCGEMKELCEFPKRKGASDGHRNVCKACIREQMENYYQNHKAHIAEQKAKYASLHKPKIAKRMREYRQNNKISLFNYNVKYREEHKVEIAWYMAEYYQKNKNKIATQSTQYRRNNKEKIATKKATYRQKNKNKIAEYHAKYYRENKTDFNQRNIQRKRLQHNAKAVNTSESLKAIIDIYKQRPEGMHVDHIIPLNHPDVCGLHVPWNLQYLTAEQNLKKNNKFDYSDPKKYDFTNNDANKHIKYSCFLPNPMKTV